jgi:hypothetical protein
MGLKNILKEHLDDPGIDGRIHFLEKGVNRMTGWNEHSIRPFSYNTR